MQLDHEFTDIAWLCEHHDSKLAERRNIVSALQLEDRDTLLDVGCGPGLWLSLLGDAIGPCGNIVGYDLDHGYLRHARRTHMNDQANLETRLVQGNFLAMPFRNESFDFIFSCNSLLYHPYPLVFLSHMLDLVKPGGRIAILHFDDAMTCYHPIAPELTLRVLTATAEALRSETTNIHYDNYLGRKLHSLFVRSGLREVRTSIHPIHRHAPLDRSTESHIRGIALWQARVGKDYLDQGTQRTWLSYFDPDSPHYVLGDSDFSYCTVEFMTIGTRRMPRDVNEEIVDG